MFREMGLQDGREIDLEPEVDLQFLKKNAAGTRHQALPGMEAPGKSRRNVGACYVEFQGSARESVKPRDSSGSAALAFVVPAAAVAG
jgi:hypothetical protein